jgi:hypothetical protein
LHLTAWISVVLVWLLLLGGAYRLVAKSGRTEGAVMAAVATIACLLAVLSRAFDNHALLPAAIIAMAVYIWRYLSPFARQARDDVRRPH